MNGFSSSSVAGGPLFYPPIKSSSSSPLKNKSVIDLLFYFISVSLDLERLLTASKLHLFYIVREGRDDLVTRFLIASGNFLPFLLFDYLSFIFDILSKV